MSGNKVIYVATVQDTVTEKVGTAFVRAYPRCYETSGDQTSLNMSSYVLPMGPIMSHQCTCSKSMSMGGAMLGAEGTHKSDPVACAF